jgi:diguanylate cyclase (GGDEF)-like protein
MICKQIVRRKNKYKQYNLNNYRYLHSNSLCLLIKVNNHEPHNRFPISYPGVNQLAVANLMHAGKMTGFERFTPRNVFIGGSIACAVILLAYVAIDSSIRESALRTLILDITSPIWSFIACLLLGYAGWMTKARSNRLGVTFYILALAILLNTLGDVTWAILQDGFGLSPFPSVADAFYLAYYPVFLIAILHLPALRPSHREAFLAFQDISIVLLASILFFWNFVLGPAIQASMQEPLAMQVLSLAYPVCDLVLLWAVILLIFRKPAAGRQVPLLVIGAAASLFLFTDWLYSYQSVLGIYASGGMLDIGWIGAYLLFALAGALQIASVRQAGAAPPMSPTNPSESRLNGWVTYLPYSWLTVAFLMLVASHYWPMTMDFALMALGVAAILSIILVRQLMTLAENSRLFRQLHLAMDQLQQQATLLSDTNRELQNEIGERQHAEDQMAFSALHDTLTGLPNRAKLAERLNQVLLLSRQRNYACKLLYLDLDKFKEINDSMGHSAGDKVLIQVAGRLQACLRTFDLVARFGGDEFVILLEDTRLMSDAILCANRILDKLRQPFEVLDRKVYISASIGILPDLRPYSNPEDVIRDADIAMYHAKSLGKSRFEIFDPDMRSSLMARMELENELRHALERDELRVLYQPIYSIKADRMLGFEALLRWRNPMRGLINPLDFIPLAEETDLIIPIGEWMLTQACTQMRQWQEEFPQEPGLTISVNISGKQLEYHGFANQVAGILADTGLMGDTLRFEITEGLCLDTGSAAEQCFKDLSSLGVRFMIDDFGSGYRSLSSLHTYPITTIKIDRSFVAKIGSENSHGFIRSIIALANDLGIETIAEGVETDVQLECLRQSGCNSIQGNLISPPIDSRAVNKFLARSKPSPFIELPHTTAVPATLAPAG